MDGKLLLAALTAALTLSATPAAAQRTAGSGGHGNGTGMPHDHFFAERCDRGDRFHRGDRGGCDHGDGWAYADGTWALYNNRSWEPDSYNDWWHDRPDRAYPRWVTDQRMSGTCAPDRMWWSGSGWHC